MESGSIKTNGVKNVFGLLGRYWLIVCTIVIFAVFGITVPGYFTVDSFMSMCINACIYAIAGFGVSMVMMIGELDWGCGVEISCGGLVVGLILAFSPIKSYLLACIISMAVMSLHGAFNAFLIVRQKLPALVATFCTSFLLKGIGVIVTKALNGGTINVYNNPNWPESFNVLGQGYLFGTIPISVLILFLLALVAYILTARTKWGKYLYAVGENPTCCEYLGIKSDKIRTLGFILCPLFCGIAGIIQSSMTNLVSIYMADQAMGNILTVIMLGALLIKPGVFTVPGTLVGGLFVAFLEYGLLQLGLYEYHRNLITGVVLFAALIMVIRFKRSAEKGVKLTLNNGLLKSKKQ